MRESSERLKRHIHELLGAGVRRTTFYPLVNESLVETKGEPRQLRRAKALAHLLDQVEQVVLPHELVAGSILGMWPLAEGLPDYEARLAEARRVVRERLPQFDPTEQRWALMARDHYDAAVRYEDLQRLAREVAADLPGDERRTYAQVFRILENHFSFDYGADVRRNFAELPWFSANHIALKYETALPLGVTGVVKLVTTKRDAAGTAEQQEFYESVRIAWEAVGRFIHRYAATLAAQGREQMAAVCGLVAEYPPQTFREAVQLTWLLHTISNIEGGSAMSFARLDQYLWPFYQRDVANGILTRDHAKELLEHVWLKVNEPHSRTVQSVILGGVDAAGREATNELTYMLVEIAGEAGEPYPNAAVRVHAGTPDRLWDTITRSVLCGCGQPMIFNDDVQVPALVRSGYPVEAAREYYNMGCIEIMVAGCQIHEGCGGQVHFASLIESVFNNGAPNLAGETGAETGPLDSLRTWEDFLNAYLRQLEFNIQQQLGAAEAQFTQREQLRCDPFASALVDDCLERGQDLCRGGVRYGTDVVNGMGFGTGVDSLSAIKTFVYDRRELTLPQVKEILDKNFAGYESVRQLLATRTPAFGNDLEDPDAIAVRVFDTFTDTILNYPTTVGARYMARLFSYHSHVRRGEVTAATPDGRYCGVSISDGPGPAQGRDVRGPTALLNSMTKLDFTKVSGGMAFNMKITPDFVRGPDGPNILRSLLKTYLANGGLQIQVNMVDRDTLRKAQEKPDEYRNIVVRIAGYCDYFVALDRKLQDEIISRSEQQPGAVAR